MTKRLSFVGLGFEVGQDQPGLRSSPELFRRSRGRLDRLGYSLLDHGDILHGQTAGRSKIRLETSLVREFTEPYRQAAFYLADSFRLPCLHLQWGGDHSVALSTVSAFLHHHPDGKVVWIDAHADMNLPEASPTGNFHGMPLAMLLDIGGAGRRHFPWIKNFLKPENLILLGVRDTDPFERLALRRLGILFFTCDEMRALGLERTLSTVRQVLGNHPVHLSFDIDGVDPESAPSTGVPVGGGLTPAELRRLGAEFGGLPQLRSLDVVEINPSLGTPAQLEQTMDVAWSFLETVLLAQQGGLHEGTDRSHQGFDPSAFSPDSPV